MVQRSYKDKDLKVPLLSKKKEVPSFLNEEKSSYFSIFQELYGFVIIDVIHNIFMVLVIWGFYRLFLTFSDKTDTYMMPSSLDIISYHRSLIPACNGYSIKSYDLNDITSYIDYLDNIQELLDKNTNKTNVPECIDFDIRSLNACSIYPYGFDEAKPCIYLTVPKTFKKKRMIEDTESIETSCFIYKDSKYIEKIKTYPDRFLIPYYTTSTIKICNSPVVAFQLKVANTTEIRCKLNIEGIDKNDYYDVDRANGKISIIIHTIKNSSESKNL